MHLKFAGQPICVFFSVTILEKYFGDLQQFGTTFSLVYFCIRTEYKHI